MYILFEITDKSSILLMLIIFVAVLSLAFIIYIMTKDDKIEPIDEEKRYDNEKPKEYFENIKPETKEQQEAKDELERVFRQMSEDLEKEKPKTVIDTFEQEQEENAVISYQELLRQAEEKRKHPNTNPEEKKFHNSENISPIFGIQKTPEYKAQIRENKPFEKLDFAYENENASDFLNSLKEFRNNL